MRFPPAILFALFALSPLLAACNDDGPRQAAPPPPTADETVAFILMRLEDGGSFDYSSGVGEHSISVRHARGTDSYEVTSELRPDDPTRPSETSVETYRVIMKDECHYEIRVPSIVAGQTIVHTIDMSRYARHRPDGMWERHEFNGSCPVTRDGACDDAFLDWAWDDPTRLDKAIAYFNANFCTKRGVF